jgi:hypothetical protein
MLVVVVGLTPVWWSLGDALANPQLGNSLSARAAEWVRDHGGGRLVVRAENAWYGRHAPPVGARLAPGAIPALPPAPSSSPAAADVGAAAGGLPPAPSHLSTPAALRPFVATPTPGEGRWHPVGRLVGGIPAVYEAFLRPDAAHTGEVTGVAWMDTKLLRAQLYSGSYVPGGGPWKFTAPIKPDAAASLVAAFNSGFRMRDSLGGYYSEGRMFRALRPGAASLVIYRDGTVTVGAWGQDVSFTPDVVAVRQNLSLLVDNGRPVAGLSANDTKVWGRTISNRIYVWRSGLGVTASGAIVYVGGPGLNITDLANVLVRAGAVRAMELDINTDWVNLATWTPASSSGAATAANGSDLLPNMAGDPSRYFSAQWARDFVTMSARSGP